jgi:hypothetical protein
MRKRKLILNILENSVKILKSSGELRIEIFNKNRVFKIFIPNYYTVRYDSSTKSLEILKNFVDNYYQIIDAHLNDMLFNFNRLWHVKLKFMGKGFKIKRRRRTKSIKFYFYYSHVNVIILKKAKLKQRKKNRFIIKT